MSRDVKRGADLVTVTILTAASALAALASPPGWLQAVLLIPLALVLPGYALAAALFPPDTIPVSQRVVHSFVLSIAAAAIGGLFLQFVVGLDRTAWACLLIGITLIATAVAWARRRNLPIQAFEQRRRRTRASFVAVFLIGVAAAGAAVSVAIAVEGTREQQQRQSFASLWAYPVDGGPDAAIEVGVWNHGGPTSYQLSVRIEGKVVENIPVHLESRPNWERILDPPVSASSNSLLIELIHAGRSYRSLELNMGT